MALNSDGRWWLKALQRIGKEPSKGIDLTLDVLEICLCKVNQLPSKFIQRILLPIKDALCQLTLLRQHDKEKRLAIAACLNEVLRILVAKAFYDDNTMLEILHLIVDSFQSLDDFSGDPFVKRFTILGNFANVKEVTSS